MDLTNFFVPKDFKNPIASLRSNRFLDKKKILDQRILVSKKIFGPENFGSRKIWVQEMSKTNKDPKEI